jgi:hypothetical protein
VNNVGQNIIDNASNYIFAQHKRLGEKQQLFFKIHVLHDACTSCLRI